MGAPSTKSFAVIFAGPPGSGKTTLGQLLCQCIDNTVYLDQDMCGGSCAIYERRIKDSNGKNIILGKCHQNAKTLVGVKNLLQYMGYGYSVYDLHTEHPRDMLDVLLERIKTRVGHQSLPYNDRTRDIISSIVNSYEPFVHKSSVKLDYKQDTKTLVKIVLDDLHKSNFLTGVIYDESVKCLDTVLPTVSKVTNNLVHIGSEYNHVRDINFIMCCDNEWFDPVIYDQTDRVIETIGKYFTSRDLSVGTQSKYYRQLCDFYTKAKDCHPETYEIYNKHVKKLDAIYRTELSKEMPNTAIVDKTKLISEISTVMEKSKHSSVIILGSFFLNFDPKQKLMSSLDISDFMKTSVDIRCPAENTLDLTTNLWVLKRGQLTMSPDFIRCVINERQKTCIDPVILGKRLIGKSKDFSPYTKDNTSSISKLFSDEYGISFSVMMKNIISTQSSDITRAQQDILPRSDISHQDIHQIPPDPQVIKPKKIMIKIKPRVSKN